MRIVKGPEERRQEIVDGAIRVFARKGYEKTAISDIAGEIGISQGLCYRYFPSKEAIYDAALDQYAAYIVEQNLARTQLAGKTLKEQILLMSGKTQEYSTTERDLKPLYDLFHKEGNRKLHDQLSLRVSEKLVPLIAQVLRTAAERGPALRPGRRRVLLRLWPDGHSAGPDAAGGDQGRAHSVLPDRAFGTVTNWASVCLPDFTVSK